VPDNLTLQLICFTIFAFYNWLVGWLTDLQIDWLIDWFINRMCVTLLIWNVMLCAMFIHSLELSTYVTWCQCQGDLLVYILRCMLSEYLFGNWSNPTRVSCQWLGVVIKPEYEYPPWMEGRLLAYGHKILIHFNNISNNPCLLNQSVGA